MGEYASVLADSTLRQRAWMAEHRARIETQLANKVKSEFIANMSHELRTPLNTVIGFAKLLGGHQRRQLRDTEIVEYADLIRDAATHLLSVINDILDISKIQSGKYTLDARELSLHSDLDSDLPLVKGDPAKLRQAFCNLISNAIKFTPPGGTVSVQARPESDGGVAVFVRDTGLGMSKEEMSLAITPFTQVDGGRSRWREGTGLGLPIAKALIQLHGGGLEIRSAKSLGTEVRVSLPSPRKVSVMHWHEGVPASAAAVHAEGMSR
jgi:two-component system cell cycle sensor histidine kinase PleC